MGTSGKIAAITKIQMFDIMVVVFEEEKRQPSGRREDGVSCLLYKIWFRWCGDILVKTVSVAKVCRVIFLALQQYLCKPGRQNMLPSF
jgi:hypothetical protein